MNEKNDFALVLRPPGALEKAVPGAKSILSGMVADTLALVKKESLGKPVFTVLIGHRSCVGDAWEMFIKWEIGEKYELRFFRFGDDCGFDSRHAAELLSLAETQPFDLIMAYCRPGEEEIEMLARLKAQYSKPIFVTSGWGAEKMAPFERAGVTVLPFLFLIEDLRRALREAHIP